VTGIVRVTGRDALTPIEWREHVSADLKLAIKSSTSEGEEAVVSLIRLIGEDPDRDGLLRTPERVVKALREMTAGYHEDPARILATTFEESSDELILLRGIEFYSICEHHLLPFYGTACVGYLPGDVVGISKLARLVHCFARRLQIQERLTRQIATAVQEHLHARGTGVIVRAHHLCMGCRGVKLPSTELITSSMLGTLRDDAGTRGEFLRLCGGNA
jgi:GTP cyclohydrolase IA